MSSNNAVQSRTTFGPGSKPVVVVDAEVVSTVPAPGNPSGAGIDSTSTAAFAAPGVAQPQTSGLTTRAPSSAPAAPVPGLLSDSDIDIENISLPVINLGQGVGDLGATFGNGAVILGQEFLLADAPKGGKNLGQFDNPGNPITVVFLGLRSIRFSEKIKGGAQGRMYPTERDVIANGGTTNWDDSTWSKNPSANAKPYFEKIATALVLVKAPECAEAPGENASEKLFPFADGKGGFWGVALWHFKGAAFTAAITKIILPARKLGALSRGGFASRAFNMWAWRKTFGSEGHAAFIPVLVLTEPTEADPTGGVPLALVTDTYGKLFGAVPKEFDRLARKAGVPVDAILAGDIDSDTSAAGE